MLMSVFHASFIECIYPRIFRVSYLGSKE